MFGIYFSEEEALLKIKNTYKKIKNTYTVPSLSFPPNIPSKASDKHSMAITSRFDFNLVIRCFFVSLLSKSKVPRTTFYRTAVMHFVWAFLRCCLQMLTYTLSRFHGEWDSLITMSFYCLILSLEHFMKLQFSSENFSFPCGLFSKA